MKIDTDTLEALLPKAFSRPQPSCMAPDSDSSLQNMNSLAGYIDGTLSNEETVLVKKHLSECDACWEIDLLARKILKEPEKSGISRHTEIDPFALDRIFEKINVFFEWLLYPATPEHARFATSEDTAPKVRGRKFEKEFNGLKTNIFFTKKKNSDKIKIEVSVSADAHSHDRFCAILKSSGGKFDTRDINDEGYAYFDNLPFSEYRFVLEQNGEEIGEFSFETVESGIYAE